MPLKSMFLYRHVTKMKRQLWLLEMISLSWGMLQLEVEWFWLKVYGVTIVGVGEDAWSTKIV